jgi:ribosome-associated translation inhibitor RaiA
MRKNLDLSGVPPAQRSRVRNLVLRRIDRLWHRLERLSCEKSVIDVEAQVESDDHNRWRVFLYLELPFGTIRAEANRCASAEAALDKAFGELASKASRRHEEIKRQRSLRRYKMARDDRRQWREEFERALAEAQDRQKLCSLGGHLYSLRREAIRLLEQLELEGDLGDCSKSVGDIVHDTLLEMYTKYESRPANLPVAAWFTRIMNEVVARDLNKNADMAPLSEKKDYKGSGNTLPRLGQW